MTSSIPTCAGCGGDLVLEIDPASPHDAAPSPLPADPPFRFVCRSADCCLSESRLL